MRPIDADKLEKDFTDWYDRAYPRDKELIEIAILSVEDAPTIEVEPDKDWISVKDRLPEPGIPVLALQFDIPHSRRVRYWLVRLVIYDTIDPSTGKKMMSWFPNYGGFCVENIAYWQPLPKTPKGEENEQTD